jgi:Cu/Ag efflux pump CusA
MVRGHSAIDSCVTLNFKDYFIYLMSLKQEEERASQKEVLMELQNRFNSVPGVQAFMQGMQLISPQGGGGGIDAESLSVFLKRNRLK